jgi:hypothetical protein
LGQIGPGQPPEPRRRAAASRTPRRGRQPRHGSAEKRRRRTPRGPRSGPVGLRSGPRWPELRTPCVAAVGTPAWPSRRLHSRDASGRRRDDPPLRSKQDGRETLDPAAPFTGIGRLSQRCPQGATRSGAGAGEKPAAAPIRVLPLHRPKEATQARRGEGVFKSSCCACVMPDHLAV